MLSLLLTQTRLCQGPVESAETDVQFLIHILAADMQAELWAAAQVCCCQAHAAALLRLSLHPDSRELTQSEFASAVSSKPLSVRS